VIRLRNGVVRREEVRMRGGDWLCVVLVLAGCAQPKEASLKQVTLAELERETADLVYFNFTGCDEAFDYFSTPDGREFKLSATESKMRHRALPASLRPPMRRGAGMILFVKLKGGQWVPPDPEQMRRLFPESRSGGTM
jgi:hypothetical protein